MVGVCGRVRGWRGGVRGEGEGKGVLCVCVCGGRGVGMGGLGGGGVGRMYSAFFCLLYIFFSVVCVCFFYFWVF